MNLLQQVLGVEWTETETRKHRLLNINKFKYLPNIFMFRIGMRKDLVLNAAERKIRFKRLIQRRQEARNDQEMSALEPINLAAAKYNQRDKSEKDVKQNPRIFLEQNYRIDRDRKLFSAIRMKVKKAEIQDLFDKNMSLRISGLGFLMNEVSFGNLQTLRMKILLNSELYMTSISCAAISNSLVSDTLGSLTFINGIPDIPHIDRKILDNILRIQSCAAIKVSKTCQNEVEELNTIDW